MAGLSMNCIICKQGEVEPGYRLYDDRYGYPGHFSTFFCQACGHGLLEHDIRDEDIEMLYTQYYPRLSCQADEHVAVKPGRGWFRTWFNGEYANAYRWVPEEVRVLDIGCGQGEALAYHEARGCEAWGTEADRNVASSVARFGYNINIGIFNKEDYPGKYFDYVTLDQVVEHLRDPLGSLKDIRQILKPGGKLVISTPNHKGLSARFFGRKWLHWHVPYHMHFFTRDSLNELAVAAGFEVLICRTVTNAAWLYMQMMHMCNYPNEGKPSVYWKDHKKLVYMDTARPAVRLIQLLFKLRVLHIANKIMDVLGIGDNYLIVLRKRELS